MNLHHPSERLPTLAAHYALGTLRGGARRRFEALAREDASIRFAAFEWQFRLAGLNELQLSVTPAPAVWTRLSNLLAAEQVQASRAPAPPSARWWQHLGLWRVASFAGIATTGVAVWLGLSVSHQQDQQISALIQQVQTLPQVKYVAVLTDAQATASLLVTFDPKQNQLTLQRVGNYVEASEKSLQLWALPPGQGPQSLGILSGQKLTHLTVSQAQVQAVHTLAISLEPLGGVRSERGPTGPVLFKGALIQKSL